MVKAKTIEERRKLKVGQIYKEPVRVFKYKKPKVGEEYPLFFERGFFILTKVLKVGDKEVTLEATYEGFGTKCPKYNRNRGWMDNLCTATDTPCYLETEKGWPIKKEICDVYDRSELEKLAIRGENPKRTPGIIDALDFM